MRKNGRVSFMKNRNGFTLIEIMVALVLVGLLAMIFLPLFTMTIQHIFLAGNRNITTYEDQESAEIIIEESDMGSSGELIITFSGVDYNIPGEGHISGKMEYFIPSSDTAAWGED